jgi:hypothetical protein
MMRDYSSRRSLWQGPYGYRNSAKPHGRAMDSEMCVLSIQGSAGFSWTYMPVETEKHYIWRHD